MIRISPGPALASLLSAMTFSPQLDDDVPMVVIFDFVRLLL